MNYAFGMPKYCFGWSRPCVWYLHIMIKTAPNTTYTVKVFLLVLPQKVSYWKMTCFPYSRHDLFSVLGFQKQGINMTTRVLRPKQKVMLKMTRFWDSTKKAKAKNTTTPGQMDRIFGPLQVVERTERRRRLLSKHGDSDDRKWQRWQIHDEDD